MLTFEELKEEIADSRNPRRLIREHVGHYVPERRSELIEVLGSDPTLGYYRAVNEDVDTDIFEMTEQAIHDRLLTVAEDSVEGWAET